MDKQYRFVSIVKPVLLGIPLILAACAPAEPDLVRGAALTTVAPELLPVDDIYITDAAYGGTGCPQGTVNYVVSPDRDQISVFFDEYFAVSDADGGTRVRKSCNVGVGLHVPQGLSVALVAMDYRGYVYVPPGAKTQLRTDYFFAGYRTGVQFDHVWQDNLHYLDEDFNLRDQFYAGAIVWSPCGEDVIIRANTSIRAYSNDQHEASEIQVDSLDATAELVYRIQWRNCDVPTIIPEPTDPAPSHPTTTTADPAPTA